MKQLYNEIVRTLRRSYCLTQKELAFLIGEVGREAIQRLESGRKKLNLKSLHKLSVVFDLKYKEINSKELESFEIEVVDSTIELSKALEGKVDSRNKRKLELLNRLMSKAALSEHTDL
jgi:transcriptional regulator with XRE-family HTH domain